MVTINQNNTNKASICTYNTHASNNSSCKRYKIIETLRRLWIQTAVIIKPNEPDKCFLTWS